MIEYIGFSGTREGMTPEQKMEVARWLKHLYYPGRWFIHGKCKGADEQAWEIARLLGYKTAAFPSNLKNWQGYSEDDYTSNPMNPLYRDRLIVVKANFMIFGPKQFEEQWRGSGTWATKRMAEGYETPFIIVFPDGTFETKGHLATLVKAQYDTGFSTEGL